MATELIQTVPVANVLGEGQLADQPSAGDLFIFQTEFKGLPATDWRPVTVI